MKTTILALTVMFFGILSCNKSVTQSQTEMLLTNESKDSVKVVITLGSGLDTMWIQDVYNMFGYSEHGTQAIFDLAPNDTLTFTPSKAIQGNISFLTKPFQCDSKYPSVTGSNIMEFCLNNNGTVTNAQETVEISCVPGVTYIGKMHLVDGGIWTANNPGYDTVKVIQNGNFGENTGRVGVYPVGCDNCTEQTSNAPKCTIGKGEQPQSKPICNVQRNAELKGGKVIFSYIKPATVID
jgi:hypothetical protein